MSLSNNIFSLGKWIAGIGGILYLMLYIIAIFGIKLPIIVIEVPPIGLLFIINLLIPIIIQIMLISASLVYNYNNLWYQGIVIVILAFFGGNIIGIFGGVLIILSNVLPSGED